MTLTDEQEALTRRITTAQVVAMQRALAEARALLARLYEIAHPETLSLTDGLERADKLDIYARLCHVADLTAPYANPDHPQS